MKKLTCYVCGGMLEVDTETQQVTCMDCGVRYTVEQVIHPFDHMQERAAMSMEEIEHWKCVARQCVDRLEFAKAEWIIQEVLMAVPQDPEAKEFFEQIQEWKQYEIKDGVLIEYHGQKKHLILPKGIVKLEAALKGWYADAGCFPSWIESVVLPDTVEVIGENAFCGCKHLMQIHWPKNLRVIGEGAFRKCESLTKVCPPDGVNTISNGAFSGCSNLRVIRFPKALRVICGMVFAECSALTEVSIPNDIRKIDFAAFQACSALRKVLLPHSLKSIGEEAFARCTSLEYICIPPSVQMVGINAFEKCCRLTHIQHESSFPRYVVKRKWFGVTEHNSELRKNLFDVFSLCPYGDKDREKLWKLRYSKGYCPECGMEFWGNKWADCPMCHANRFNWFLKLKWMEWRDRKAPKTVAGRKPKGTTAARTGSNAAQITGTKPSMAALRIEAQSAGGESDRRQAHSDSGKGISHPRTTE